ncbi:hypothetical protein BaRGS_00006125 [Batillaria attramentaria]|uniref:C-type lectin domain-containing protein n=1 Tax=Batillaria attramentaria TaxID=370345 RepID=A0ABD0LSJ2_9CAEN
MATEDSFTVLFTVLLLLSGARCLTSDIQQYNTNDDGELTHAQTNDTETLSTDIENSVVSNANGNGDSTEDSFKTEGMSIMSGSSQTTQSSVVQYQDSTQSGTSPIDKPLTPILRSQDGHVTGLHDFDATAEVTNGTAAMKNLSSSDSNAGNLNLCHWATFTNGVSESTPSLPCTMNDAVTATEPLMMSLPHGTSSTEASAAHGEPNQTRYSRTGASSTENKFPVSPQNTSSTPELTDAHQYTSYLTLSSVNLSACFQHQEIPQFYASEGFVSFNLKDLYNNENPFRAVLGTKCDVKFHVPNGLVIHVHDFYSRGWLVDITSPDVYAYARDELTKHEDFYTRSHLLSMRFQFQVVTSFGLFFQFRFTAIPKSSLPKLEVVFTSPAGGYIQTPGWDGKSTYPTNMDTWAQVKIPTGHSVLISFQAVDLDFKARLILYLGGYSTEDSIIIKTSLIPLPFLYDRSKPWINDTMEITAHFSSDYDQLTKVTGVRMLFSFHNNTALPEQLSDGKWNCSVPYWDDFRHHFLCDFKQDCDNGEDERQCLYKNHTCGEGWVWLEGKCYLYVRDKQYLTWYDASVACQDRGGYLASLNTPDEYLTVLRFLQARADSDVYSNVYVGLRSASPFLPRM